MDNYSPERMTTAGGHPRFVRADIARHPAGGLVVTTPRGQALRVHLTQDELMAVLGECDGQRPLLDVAARAPGGTDLLAFLLRLQAEGCLTTLPAANAADWVRFPCEELDPGRPLRTGLVVVGHGQLAAATRRFMGDAALARFRDVTYA